MRNALLVYPEYPPSYWGINYALEMLGASAAFPPLGLLTVAAMFPPEYDLRVVDMNVTDLEDSDLDWADMVFTSTMIVQRESLRTVIERCNHAGVSVVAGGPYPTSCHQEIEGVDHFVLDEAEETFSRFLRDLEEGKRQDDLSRAAQARRHAYAHPAVRPHRVAGLSRHVRAVLARLPVRLRVLRHHQALWARAPHQVSGTDGRGVREAVSTGLARLSVPGRRQLHRQQARRAASAAGDSGSGSRRAGIRSGCSPKRA